MTERHFRAALLAIMVIGVVRGMFWVVTFPVVYSDEGQHLSYVESLAEYQRFPVTGRDHITEDTITLFKNDHVGPARSQGVTASVSDPGWGLVREQYEGFQGPLYYLLMAPLFRVGRHFGLLAAVYTVRVATLLLSLTAVPLVALLARELFPEHPPVWLLAPATLVALELFNSQFSLVTNDGVMVPLGALCLLLLARAGRGLTLRRGVAFGAAVGLCALGKGSAPALAPALLIGFVALLVTRRPAWRQVAVWAAAAAVTAAVLVSPWVAFNEHAYGSVSGIRANARLTASVIPPIKFSASGVVQLARIARSTLFTMQSLTSIPAANHYRLVWGLGSAVLVAVGLVGAAATRRWAVLARLAWCGVSVLAGCAVLVLLIFGQAGGGGNIVGRHLGVLLPQFCILVAASAATALGARLGTGAVLLFLVMALVTEVPAARWWVRTTYAEPAVSGRLVPVVEQSLNAGPVEATGVDFKTPCPLRQVAFIFDGPAPPAITAAGAPAAPAATDQPWTIYGVAAPVAGPASVDFGQRVRLRAASPGRPDIRLYCEKADPGAVRFATLYPPEHPFGLTLGELLAWPLIEAVAGVALALAGALYVGRQRKS